MRIQNNIQAMNAYRNYQINSGSLAKNLEKLSSGYRINRAGDDAAGLAISEKMRAQISGLTAAQKNVKDGVSLIKVAEGAMQEIQDMLNRMDTLAVQSANGTYQDEVDRQNLQKEVQAVKTEIDRIAGSANFNGIRLLDGSLRQDVLNTVKTASPAAPGKSHDEILDEIIDEILREEEEKGNVKTYESISALMLYRTGTRAVITPAKKTVLTFDFEQLAGEYRRGDWINIKSLGGPFADIFDGRTITFHPDHSAGDINIGYRNGKEIADAFRKSFMGLAQTKGDWTLGGQTFTWSVNGSVLTVEQKNAPEDESQLVDKTEANFVVTVNRVKPAEVIGTPKDSAAFGDKAEVTKTYSQVVVTAPDGTRKGTINVSKFNVDAVVDYMRAHGITGNSLGGNRNDHFYLQYDSINETYEIGMIRSPGVIIGSPVKAVVTTTSGAMVPSSNGIPLAGQVATLDFGELGSIIITGESDFEPLDFDASPNKSISVIKNAQSANGGSLAFNITDDQRKKLVDRADALDVRSPDSKNPTPVDIEMQWNTDHFELVCGGKVLASSGPRNVTDTGSITFYINPSDPSTAIATADLNKTTPDPIGADAFAGGVATGLQFKVPDTNTVTKTTKTFQFTPGSLAVETPDPGKPDPPGPDDPNKPGKPDDPNGPGGTDRPGSSGNPYGPSGGGKGLILQIGDTSASHDRLEVFIGDMHVRSMGSRDKWGNVTASIFQVDIGTQAGAQAALAVIRDAINYVSGVRGDLGAYQNRLEHTAAISA